MKLTIAALQFVRMMKLLVWITTNCEKFLKMGIPDNLTCLLRNLYTDQEATVRTRHGTTDWFQIGKRVHQVCILSPCLFNLHAKFSLFSCLVVSDFLWPHGLQHIRLPCPSPSPKAYSNWCPLSQWCHQPSHPWSSPYPPAFNISQYQCLF